MKSHLPTSADDQCADDGGHIELTPSDEVKTSYLAGDPRAARAALSQPAGGAIRSKANQRSIRGWDVMGVGREEGGVRGLL